MCPTIVSKLLENKPNLRCQKMEFFKDSSNNRRVLGIRLKTEIQIYLAGWYEKSWLLGVRRPLPSSLVLRHHQCVRVRWSPTPCGLVLRTLWSLKMATVSLTSSGTNWIISSLNPNCDTDLDAWFTWPRHRHHVVTNWLLLRLNRT